MIGLATLGAIYGRGKRRAIWFGAALFGAGYHDSDLRPGHSTSNRSQGERPTTYLNALRPGCRPLLPSFPPRRASAANARIQNALDRPVPMQFANETPLEEVLAFITKETVGPDGIPIAIYVDPVGLNEAEKTMTSPMTLDLQGVALKTTLGLVLQQLGLIYSVREGVLLITAEHSEDPVAGLRGSLSAGRQLLARPARGRARRCACSACGSAKGGIRCATASVGRRSLNEKWRASVPARYRVLTTAFRLFAAGDAFARLEALEDFLDGHLELAVAAGEVVFGGVLDEDVGLDAVVLHVGARRVGEVDADAGGADRRAVDQLVAAGADDGAHRRRCRPPCRGRGRGSRRGTSRRWRRSASSGARPSDRSSR